MMIQGLELNFYIFFFQFRKGMYLVMMALVTAITNLEINIIQVKKVTQINF